MKNKYPIQKWENIPQISLHYQRPNIHTMQLIEGVEGGKKLFRKFYSPYIIDVKETFWAVFLTPNLKVLAVSEIAKGGQKCAFVNVKEIVQLALLTHAMAVMIGHNHPSGSLVISHEDKQLTEKVKKALSLIDVKLLDHFILTSESEISLAEEGFM